MKIGLCTPYKIANYGTKLQAYAVQTKIESLGYEVEVINFLRKSDLRPNKLFYRYFSKEFIKNKLNQRKQDTISIEEVAIGLKKRMDAINSFDKSHYQTTSLIKGFSGLRKKSENYSAVVCGSDQIWLPSNVYNPTVTLEFAREGCKKIAFAPSFGVSEIPNKSRKEYVKFLKNMDSISVREESGKWLIKDLIGEDVDVVLDPTLTIDQSVWYDLASTGKEIITEPYIFCYFLGTNIEHRKQVEIIAKQKKLKIVTLPHFIEFNEYDEKYADYKLYDVTPCDFLKLIKNAECICTDSFHASVFSILFEKTFFTFERFNSKDHMSTNSRIYSLLSQLGLEDRLVKGVSDDLKYNINFEEPFDKLEKLRNKTDTYLQEAFKDIPTNKKNNRFITPKESDCCGCTACASICPTNCIQMRTNKKDGFLYPEIVNDYLCIECGMCNKVCSLKNELNVSHSFASCKAMFSKLSNTRVSSTTGGVYYELASYIIQNDGYVCAAVFNDDFSVTHRIIKNNEDLNKTVGSKYVESNLIGVFKNVKEILEKGKILLFCGTPCELHGLKNYLVKDYDNLLTIDLLCYGIQSPKVWSKYLNEVAKGKKIKSINMRDKSISWEEYGMKINFADESNYFAKKDNDLYLKSYTTGLFLRPSCHNCQLKAFPRKSDITLGDYWDINEIDPTLNDKKGINIVIENTEKGKKILSKLIENDILFSKDIDINKLNKVHPLFCLSVKKNRKKDKFFSMIENENITFNQAINKCIPSKFENQLKIFLRKIKNR